MTGLARLRCPLADTPTVFLTVHRTVKIRLRRTDLFEPPFQKSKKIMGILSDTHYFFGADDGARTRYLHLGKVALYQMSYIRI